MDLIIRIGEFALALIAASLMLYFAIMAADNMSKTQDYVTNQNYSDAYTNRYASLSSFNVDTVGKVSVQEVLDLIYTYAQDTTPVIVSGPDNNLRVFVADNGGWIYSSSGKPMGMKIDQNGGYYNGEYDTAIGYPNGVEVATEAIPEYQDLYNYLSNNQQGDVHYYVNIDPDNSGSLQTILVKAVN